MDPYRTSRRLVLLALGAWAIAWVLPTGGESFGHSAFFGWRCYLIAIHESPGQLMSCLSANSLHRPLRLLVAISPWTNLLVPLAILRLDCDRAAGLRTKLPFLFIGAWIVNLVWLKIMRDNLQLGYFLWLTSFLGLGLAIFALQKQEAAQARSPFVSEERDATSSPVARIVFLILLGLAVQGLVGWAILPRE